MLDPSRNSGVVPKNNNSQENHFGGVGRWVTEMVDNVDNGVCHMVFPVEVNLIGDYIYHTITPNIFLF